jgi:ribosome biogenesis protein MAK21
MEALKLLEKTGKVSAVTIDPLLKLQSEGDKWYSDVAHNVPITNPKLQLSEKDVSAIEAKLPAWLDAEVKRYKKYRIANPSSDSKWVKDIIKSGTHSDKVAAMSLLISESPVHNLESLDALIALAFKKEQRTAILALEALKDLLITNLLPDRHLVPVDKQDWSKTISLETALLNWFEAQLIVRVDKILDAIEAALKSNVDFFKKRSLELAMEILSSKPEKESRILRLITNKMGDPSKNIGSKAMEVLKSLLKLHPSMKSVVAREVRQLIYWAGQSMRIVFICCVFLTQMPLNHGDHVVAADLVDCYMGLFEKAVAQGEVGSSLLSILLNGVNKAFPYLDDVKPLTQKIDALFKIVHTASFSASTQALLLISFIALSDNVDAKDAASKGPKDGTKEVAKDENDLTNRYYRALYSKLSDEQIATKSRNTVFFNLLYRSLKRDKSTLRCAAFVKRLLMMTLHAKPTVVTGLMLLIAEVCKANKVIGKMMSPLTEAKHYVPPATYGASADKKKTANGDENNSDDGNHVTSQNESNLFDGFDVSKREPLYATTTAPNLWELSLLGSHFHPSVRAFTGQLRGPEHSIGYNGDPTSDFSIKAFLDRFAYKNPKLKNKDGKSGLPAAEKDGEELPINLSAEMLKAADISAIAPEKQFFYKYFGDREKLREEGRSRDRSRNRRHGADEDEGFENESEMGDAALDRDEAEIDAFADKLAEELMASGAGEYTDPDIDDFDEDFDEDDDMDDDEDDDFDDAPESDNEEGGAASDDDDDDDVGMFDREVDGVDEDADDDDDEEDFDGSDVETDAIDFEDYLSSKQKGKQANAKNPKKSYQLAVYNEDDDEDVNPSQSRQKKASSTKKRKAKSDEDGDFADAADYEEEMDAIVTQYSLDAAAAAESAAASKKPKGGKSVPQQRGVYNIGPSSQPKHEAKNKKARK